MNVKRTFRNQLRILQYKMLYILCGKVIHFHFQQLQYIPFTIQRNIRV